MIKVPSKVNTLLTDANILSHGRNGMSSLANPELNACGLQRIDCLRLNPIFLMGGGPDESSYSWDEMTLHTKI